MSRRHRDFVVIRSPFIRTLGQRLSLRSADREQDWSVDFIKIDTEGAKSGILSVFTGEISRSNG